MNKGKCNTTHCPECEATSYTRNNYFTGKLMVERDFTDEQRYFREKIRLHHQRLHGTGVVCGLMIQPHENITCQDRYILLDAGSAIDCCGQDILVAEPENIDLYAFPEFVELLEKADDAENHDETHSLQICIRYRECGSEEIPVLYDDCSCDDNSSAPNRILESYELDLIIDPEKKLDNSCLPSVLSMNWSSTINIANASRVVVDEANNRLFVATGDNAGTLYQASTINHIIESSVPLGGLALDIALSTDGKQLFSILHDDGVTNSDPLVLKVFDVSSNDSLNTVPPVSGDVPNSQDNGEIRLAVADDGRLLAMIGGPGNVISWAPGLIDPASPDRDVSLHPDLLSLSLSRDKKHALIARTGNGVLELDLSASDFAPVETLLSGITPQIIATIPATGEERHVVLDRTNGGLGIVNLKSEPADILEHSLALAYEPVSVVISDGGHWAWVLENDGTDNYLQAINLTRLRQALPDVSGTPIKVGINGDQLALARNDSRLYLPWPDDIDVTDSGGVTIIDITDKDCLARLCNPHPCPSCDTADCLVLATITDWSPGDSIKALEDKQEGDQPAKTAWIDNQLGRKILPSTQDIADALKCVIENCCGESEGGTGMQGPPGENGTDGIDGQDGTDGQDGMNGLNGTNGIDGKDGVGLDPNYPRICEISWPHAGEVGFDIEESGLIIAFDSPVKNADLNVMSIHVLVKTDHPEHRTSCWCDVQDLDIRGLIFNKPCDFNEGIDVKDDPSTDVDGVMLRFSVKRFEAAQVSPVIRIIINGDFIRGKHKLTGEPVGLDADHLPPWLPQRITGDGIEGGSFESWFTVKSDPTQPGDNGSFNRVPIEAIINVLGDSTAVRNVAEIISNGRPYSSWAKVLDIDGIGRSRLETLKKHFTLD